MASALYPSFSKTLSSGTTYSDTLILATATGGTGGNGGSGGGCFGGRGGGDGGEGGYIQGTTNKQTGNYTFTYSGLVAISAGGRGGNGGSTSSLSYDGGNGGNGGSGGEIWLSNYIAMKTSGADAYGVWLQSVGGQGGNGGNESSPLSSGNGGKAGAGGPGGMIVFFNYAPITTTQTTGIFAQSIGGNGGSGGGASGWFGGLSGGGGYGGDSGELELVNGASGYNASITTAGAGSYGIYAQSGRRRRRQCRCRRGPYRARRLRRSGRLFGAGGGSQLFQHHRHRPIVCRHLRAVPRRCWRVGRHGLQRRAGSFGFSRRFRRRGGAGNQLVVVNYGTLCTGACNGGASPSSSAGGSYGILAQSLGGGGGAGGFGLSGSASAVAGLSITVGGSGGDGGSAMGVFVGNTGPSPRPKSIPAASWRSPSAAVAARPAEPSPSTCPAASRRPSPKADRAAGAAMQAASASTATPIPAMPPTMTAAPPSASPLAKYYGPRRSALITTTAKALSRHLGPVDRRRRRVRRICGCAVHLGRRQLRLHHWRNGRIGRRGRRSGLFRNQRHQHPDPG